MNPFHPCHVTWQDDKVLLLATSVEHGLTGDEIAAITKSLSAEEAIELGHALIEAAKAKAN
ncbi:hypothetical protein [Variovorax sp. PAMC 28711]|uniref:hypothetical protein n=1 Tax=Variovorax sp. PAMC 28711 TaxID=1795631 RepID=UPI00078B5C94|nr:hypothetical protein [Variovorax sp. PAMC 28711]AMM23191.1 hypothetical protein AX767_01470 [Variovorax sp. PAMC 28711]